MTYSELITRVRADLAGRKAYWSVGHALDCDRNGELRSEVSVYVSGHDIIEAGTPAELYAAFRDRILGLPDTAERLAMIDPERVEVQ